MGLAASPVGTFLAGLATPLGAVCVLPLYPGFLAYLSNQRGETSVARLGVYVTAGVLLFMGAVGLLFSTVLQRSLTGVIGVVSPVAFGLLAVLGVVLLLGGDVSRWVPDVEPPTSRHPRLSALGYGFFFGAIVIPCNPAFVALLFARALLLQDPVGSIAHFLAFGLGMAAPLLAFALVSERWSRRVLGVLTAHRGAVNRLSGAAVLGVAVYYLVVVFGIVPGV